MSSSGLSDTQEKIISILPIPAAALSICGSASIIYIALRTRRGGGGSGGGGGGGSATTRKEWTPYTRLMIAISSCDIIYSITMSLSGFLLPMETSPRVWAIGSDATCSALGFFSQFLVSVLCYNGMLSFYFLLSARYGVKNVRIASKWYYEPLMHIISLGYPLAAGFYGLYAGVFHENELGQGCWVNCEPGDDESESGSESESCNSVLLGWFFGGGVTVLSFISIIGNNLVIFCFVRGQTVTISRRNSPTREEESNNGRPRRRCKSELVESMEEGSKGETSDEQRSKDGQELSPPPRQDTEDISESDDGDADDLPRQESYQGNSDDRSVRQHANKHQLKRLKLVASQAFLYVMAFGLTTTWTALLQGIQSVAQGSGIDANELEKKLYPILVLQCVFLPSQGIFNFLVYIRPKYLKCKGEFPHVSTSAILRHIVYGTRLPPAPNSKSGNQDAARNHQGVKQNNTIRGIPHPKQEKDDDCSKKKEQPVRPQQSQPITHSISDSLTSSRPENRKWEEGGSSDTALVPMPHRLSNVPTISSVTGSQGDTDGNVYENNHQNGSTSPDVSLLPIVHRLMNAPWSSLSASSGDFNDSTIENIKWEDGSPDVPLVMSRPAKSSSEVDFPISENEEDNHEEMLMLYDDSHCSAPLAPREVISSHDGSSYCFPRVSSLEMISELTTASEIEMEHGIVRSSENYDSSLDDVSIPSYHNNSHASYYGGARYASGGGGSGGRKQRRAPTNLIQERPHFQQDDVSQTQGSRRWSASVSPRADDSIESLTPRHDKMIVVVHPATVVAGGGLGRKSREAATQGSDGTSSTGTDGPLPVPKRRSSPPPCSQRQLSIA